MISKFITGKLILASASPRRQELLRLVGLQPEVRPSQVEEIITSTDPELVVMELSQQKAADIAAGCSGEKVTVLGADTVVAVDGIILGKPKDTADAIQMLKRLQGSNHQVYTGVTLIACDTGRQITFAECTDVAVFPMTDEEIQAYAATNEPLDKAGAYGIQGCFAAYIRAIHGDYNNVVGLPVGRVFQELKRLESDSHYN